MHLLAVAIGGALGSCARVLLSAAVLRYAGAPSLLGIFLVNVTGCFAFGVIAALADRHAAITPAMRAFVLAGLLGGFTTFSTYTFDTFALLRDGRIAYAVANAAGQVLLGLAALWVGYEVVK